MTIIPAIRLSPSDLAHLGNNVGPAVRRDHEQFHAINRSLAIHDEQLAPPPEVDPEELPIARRRTTRRSQ